MKSLFKNLNAIKKQPQKFQRTKHRYWTPGLKLLLLACTGVIPLILIDSPANAATCGVGGITRISSPVFYIDTGANPSPLPQGMYVGYTIKNTSGSAYPDLWVKLENFIGTRLGLASTENGIVHVGPLAAGASKTVYFYLMSSGTGNTSTPLQTHTVSLYPTRPDLAASNICSDPFSLTVEETIKAVANKITTVVSGPTPPELGGVMTMTVKGDTGTIGSAGIFGITPASLINWSANAYKLVGTQMSLSGGNTGTFNDILYKVLPNTQTTSYTLTYTFIATGSTVAPTTVSPVSQLSSGTQVKHNDTGEFASLPPIQPTVNNVTLSKSVNTPIMATGGVATYTITLKNTGTIPVTLDDIVDQLPSSPGVVSYINNSAKFNGSAIANPNIAASKLTFLGLFTVPAGGTSTLTYEATIPNTVGSYSNSAVGHIGATQIDKTTNTSDNVPAIATIVVGQTDLSLAKTVDNATPTVGSNITYAIAVTNNGPNPTSGVIVKDILPSQVSYVSDDSSGSYNSTTGNWNVGSLNNGETKVLNITVQANSAGTFSNTAELTASSLPDPDSTPNNNTVGEDDQASVSVNPVAVSTFTISGTLYEDSDGGDDLDASEPKLPAAVKVILYKDNNNNNTVDTGEEVTNTPTNDQGQYTFTNVAAGTYKVKVDTSDNDIPNGLTLGTSNNLTVNVSTAAVNNINFGFDRAQVSFEPDPPTPDAEPNPPVGICAAPGSDGTSTLSGVVNTYYPGTQSASVGATQITIGAATGLNSPIKKGDKLLIIQMQDAEINSTNTDSYGNGNPGGAGSGSTAFNTSGYYEYVVANNSVAATGGNLEIKTPLAYTFTHADASSSRGQRRFQVIRLPQYRNATISSTVTAAPWNGRSGGIVAVDVADTLTFSGAGKIDVSGQGFRGGGGRNTNGNGQGLPAPGNTDYVSMSTNSYHGSKGEGIAGTPKYIRNDVTTSVTVNPDEGYPNGSFGRGAPGNAGGGSTDPNQQTNAANTGGGGGANRGFGGKGGDSWTDGYGRQPVGGFGGQAFLTTVNRIIMGGGGGAGTSNNSPTGNVPSGGGGGGIVMVRAGKIAGTGTIEANGFQGVQPSGTDGGGGGGAGGTVLIESVYASTPSLTINARGGKGLDSGYFEHGPGGGGGGGYIAFQGITPTTDVSAGQPGNDKAGGTVNSAPDPYGATAGANGLFEQKTIPAAGVKRGAECLYPNVLLVKRITSVNNQTQNSGSDNLAAYKDQDTNPYDDNNITITNPNPPVEAADTKNWLDPTTFLIGGTNGGNVKPGDEIEYTIYYLSTGDTTASKVLICDRVPENVTFLPTAFNSFATKNSDGLKDADRGIVWQYNGATQSLTNTKDGDTAEYLAPGIDPVSKYPSIKCDGSNTNGVVVVNLGNLPNATAPGTPINSYGFIRFRGKVK